MSLNSIFSVHCLFSIVFFFVFILLHFSLFFFCAYVCYVHLIKRPYILYSVDVFTTPFVPAYTIFFYHVEAMMGLSATMRSRDLLFELPVDSTVFHHHSSLMFCIVLYCVILLDLHSLSVSLLFGVCFFLVCLEGALV